MHYARVLLSGLFTLATEGEVKRTKRRKKNKVGIVFSKPMTAYHRKGPLRHMCEAQTLLCFAVSFKGRQPIASQSPVIRFHKIIHNRSLFRGVAICKLAFISIRLLRNSKRDKACLYYSTPHGVTLLGVSWTGLLIFRGQLLFP